MGHRLAGETPAVGWGTRKRFSWRRTRMSVPHNPRYDAAPDSASVGDGQECPSHTFLIDRESKPHPGKRSLDGAPARVSVLLSVAAGVVIQILARLVAD